MKLKLDENLGERGRETFQSAGHDVTTVADQGMISTPDPNLIAVCHSESRCLVTLDLDFSNPLQFPPSAYSGIAVLRPGKPLTMAELLACCKTFVSALKQDDITGRLWIVESHRIRRYQPPSPDSP